MQEYKDLVRRVKKIDDDLLSVYQDLKPIKREIDDNILENKEYVVPQDFLEMTSEIIATLSSIRDIATWVNTACYNKGMNYDLVNKSRGSQHMNEYHKVSEDPLGEQDARTINDINQSVGNVIQARMNEFNKITTKEEMISWLESIRDDVGKNFQKSLDAMISNVQRKPNDASAIKSAWDFYLAGSGNRVIK